MSLDSAKAFAKKILEDKEFSKSFFACSDPESREAFIKNNGFEFTKEEIDDVRQSMDVSAGGACGQTCETEVNGQCVIWATKWGFFK